jgi:hypothetical protein
MKPYEIGVNIRSIFCDQDIKHKELAFTAINHEYKSAET